MGKFNTNNKYERAGNSCKDCAGDGLSGTFHFLLEEKGLLFLVPCIDHDLFPVQVFAERNPINTVADTGTAIGIIGACEAMVILPEEEKAAAGLVAQLQ